jgi:hypothetical protein
VRQNALNRLNARLFVLDQNFPRQSKYLTISNCHIEARAYYTRKISNKTTFFAALLLDASTEDSTAENILKAMQLFASLAASLGLPKLRYK